MKPLTALFMVALLATPAAATENRGTRIAMAVALLDVRDLVREDTGQLGFVGRGGEQPLVNADEAAGQGEGIDGRILHQEKLEALAAFLGLGGDPRADRLQVVVDFRVVEDLALLAQVADDHPADLVFIAERQRRIGA